VIASGLFEFFSSYEKLDPSMIVATVVATLVSFAVGFSVIVGLLRYLNRGSFMPFVIWRVAVGIALLVMLNANQLAA